MILTRGSKAVLVIGLVLGFIFLATDLIFYAAQIQCKATPDVNEVATKLTKKPVAANSAFGPSFPSSAASVAAVEVPASKPPDVTDVQSCLVKSGAGLLSPYCILYGVMIIVGVLLAVVGLTPCREKSRSVTEEVEAEP